MTVASSLGKEVLDQRNSMWGCRVWHCHTPEEEKWSVSNICKVFFLEQSHVYTYETNICPTMKPYLNFICGSYELRQARYLPPYMEVVEVVMTHEVAPLMAPKSVTPWAHTLLHHGRRFKEVECWWSGTFISVGWDVGLGTLCLTSNQTIKSSPEILALHEE